MAVHKLKLRGGWEPLTCFLTYAHWEQFWIPCLALGPFNKLASMPKVASHIYLSDTETADWLRHLIFFFFFNIFFSDFRRGGG